MGYQFNPFTGKLDDTGPSTTPGGSDTQVQFNDGGSFGGDAGLTYNKTTDVLTFGGAAMPNGANRTISVNRETAAATAGRNANLEAGGATSGSTDKAGGDVVLQGGTSTGYNTSGVLIKGAPIITTGGLGTVTVDTTLSDAGWSVNDTATDAFLGGGGVIQITAVDGSGIPTTATVTTAGTGYDTNSIIAFTDGVKYVYAQPATLTGTGDNTPVNIAKFYGDKKRLELNPDSTDNVKDATLQINAPSSNQPSYLIRTYNPNSPTTYFAVTPTGFTIANVLQVETSVLLNYADVYGYSSDGAAFNYILSADGTFNTTAAIITPQGGLGTYQNLAYASENLNNSPWSTSNASVTADNVVAPNGLTTADTVTTTGANGFVQQIRIVSSGTYTLSAYVKSDTNAQMQMSVGGGSTLFTASSAWQRVSVTTSLNGSSTIKFQCNSAAGNTFSVWGVQLELASTAGPYVPTTGTILSSSQKGLISSGGYGAFPYNVGFGGVLTPTTPIDLIGTINGSGLVPPSPPRTGTPTSGGSVTTGTHSYKVTYVTAYGETLPSAKSDVRTIGASNKTVPVSIPIGPTGVTSRKLYRTVAGDTGNWKLVTTVADNTTTSYSDTTADGSLGADAPTTDTTANLKLSTGGTTAVTIDPSQKVGIGTTAPVGTLDIVTAATNDDPTLSVRQARVATTDATVTTLQTIAIAASTTYLLEARVVARRTGGSGGTADDGAVYIRRCMVTTKTGTVTINAVQDDLTQEDQAGWDCTFTVSGTDVLLRVTGAANNSITWHTTTFVQLVGT